MKDVLDFLWEYQFYWAPLLVGMTVGMLAIATGNLVLRRRRPSPTEGAADATSKPDYDPFVQGSPSEQRKAYRREGNPVKVLYRLVDDHIHHNGVVLDRSVGGLRLGLDGELAAGTRLQILPANASDMVPWTDIEIRTCRKIDDSWEAGCQFVKVPPWSILLMFG